MSKPEFVYVSYIRTTPELLYRALTERVFMERYWGIVVRATGRSARRSPGNATGCARATRAKSCTRPIHPGACPTPGT